MSGNPLSTTETVMFLLQLGIFSALVAIYSELKRLNEKPSAKK